MPVFAKVVRYFEEVARRGSIRRAAEYLHVTASAVDRQILLLEERIGTPLFERLPRGVQLTAAGELVLQSIRELAKTFDSTVAAVDALRGLRRGHVTVCGLQFLADSVFPRFIRDTREHHSGISIAAYVGTTEEVLRDVINGDADFGICYVTQGRLPVTVLQVVTLGMGAVVAPSHPIASLAKVHLTDCMQFPMVLPRRGMELRSRIERIQAHAAIELRPTIETNSIALMKLVLRDGAGVGFLTEADVASEVREGQVVWIPLAEPTILPSTLSLIVRAQRSLPLAASAVLKHLEVAFASIGPSKPNRRRGVQRPKKRNTVTKK